MEYVEYDIYVYVRYDVFEMYVYIYICNNICIYAYICIHIIYTNIYIYTLYITYDLMYQGDPRGRCGLFRSHNHEILLVYIYIYMYIHKWSPPPHDPPETQKHVYMHDLLCEFRFRFLKTYLKKLEPTIVQGPNEFSMGFHTRSLQQIGGSHDLISSTTSVSKDPGAFPAPWAVGPQGRSARGPCMAQIWNGDLQGFRLSFCNLELPKVLN